ncbi:imidazole glycerol phosphate synthase subunit HisH [Pelomonas sp. SE-A7]|uniref:imidazole glycerol phosphate synthase subunit HisH n=1 Tax=Pelomonas sp. SE-A7 TaxID=3054953 RepID=UPI00259C942D|nr:imidazole glycerol phosphate synthase subunit HisH [Pelomonas sp. SE-A7]MDM4767514.1 imidazole glycerol phosphate synthase subunit HisH [Pelomonas sp. SE-A7]
MSEAQRPIVTVIDYGSGNLFSVARALEHVGAEARLSHGPAEIEQAERLLLPGVGAFEDGMQGLRERGLIEAIRRYASSGKPLLGICLGMQMLASVGEEFGVHEGLGLIPGRVVPVPAVDLDGSAQKIPHIGWADLSPAAPGAWQDSIFAGTAEGSSVYLVHSFQFRPDDEANRLADCFYGGHRIAAAVRSGRIVGCQFHPEKSGEAGLALLRAFVQQT